MSGILVRLVLLEIARPAFVQSLHFVATINAVSTNAAIVAVFFGAFSPAFNSRDGRMRMVPT